MNEAYRGRAPKVAHKARGCRSRDDHPEQRCSTVAGNSSGRVLIAPVAESSSATSSPKLTSRIVAVHSAKHSSQVPKFTSRRYALPTLAILGRMATQALLVITCHTPCCSISKPSNLDTYDQAVQAGIAHSNGRRASSPRQEGRIIRLHHTPGDKKPLLCRYSHFHPNYNSLSQMQIIQTGYT